METKKLFDPRKVKLVLPENYTGLKLGKPKDNSAGIPAVMQAFRHISKETGLLTGLRLLGKMNQHGGFDCAGCAWPDPKGKRSKLAEYCENGAKALAEEATKKRVDPPFFEKHSVEELSNWSDYQLGKAGRITHPVVLEPGASHYKPLSWEAAFKQIGESLNHLDNPDEAIFYTSGRTSNEAAFMYQLMVRQYGTNNMPDCSNMCHESSGTGLSETLGIGKGSVTLEDLYIADLILVIGQNPGTNHPRMLNALKKCRKNGGTLVSINPLPETGLKKFTNPQEPLEVLRGGTSLVEHFLQVKINGDVALLKGIMRILLEKEDAAPGTVFDKAFIEAQTQGYEAFIEDLRTIEIAEMSKRSGISESQMRTLADLVATKEKIIICWAMGLTQHKNAVGNIREIVNLLLLRGSIGKPGAGTCPVRGHSNVQGDRTMGIWEKPKPAFLDQLEKQYSFKAPRDHGYDTVEAIKAMHEGKAKVFIGMGGNFISATPDSLYTAEAMQKCQLTVQVSTKLNRAHIVTGDRAIILPCIARSELDVQQTGPQFVSVENSMGIVHSSKGFFRPASGELKSEPAIIAGMARAILGPDNPTDWEGMITNYDRIREQIEAVIPGFEQYNKRVREPDGFFLPNGARKGTFNTDTGKAKFTLNPVPNHELKKGQYLMMTIRSHDQYNTTIYGLDDRYRGILNERRVVLMHEEDMQAAGIKSRQSVDLTSHFEGEERVAKGFLAIPYSIPRGCVATYFPEANVLVPINQVAEKSNTPASKSVVVSIHTN